MITDQRRSRQYIEAVEDSTGTYASFRVSNASAEALVKWCKSIGITPIEPSSLHVTTVFSREADIRSIYPPYNGEELILDPSYYSLGTLQGKDQVKTALVLHVYHPVLVERWQLALDLGATWSYPEYHPHITLSYDESSEVASKLINDNVKPTFWIGLSNEVVTFINTNWADTVKKAESMKNQLKSLVESSVLVEFTKLPSDINQVQSMLKSKGYAVTTVVADGEGGRFFYASAQNGKAVSAMNQVEVHQWNTTDSDYDLFQRGGSSKQLASDIDNLEGLMSTINRVMNESFKEGIDPLHAMTKNDFYGYAGASLGSMISYDCGMRIDNEPVTLIYDPEERIVELSWTGRDDSFLSFSISPVHDVTSAQRVIKWVSKIITTKSGALQMIRNACLGKDVQKIY